MARAAVKAKQQEKAKAQPAKASRRRGRRRHSGGGNPNQELFFVKLRRGQKWLYGLLAVVFAVGFVGIGVGSGNSGGLSQLYTGLFGGGGGDSVSKAQDAIKKDPAAAKGYRELATAYEGQGHPVLAITALQRYLAKKGQDAPSWAELGGLQMSQANTYATQYQSAQTAAQTADPSAPFLPGGTLGSAVGQNPAYADASQAAATRTSTLYQQAIGAATSAVTSYQRASKIQPRNATYLQELATAAQNAGNSKVELNALRRYLRVYPNSPLKSQYEKAIKALSKSASTPAVQPGG
jgi:tetratricopeptide (TPR) repeat protein